MVPYGGTFTFPDPNDERKYYDEDYNTSGIFTRRSKKLNDCYSFIGWKYKGITYTVGDEISLTGEEEATLTAVWKEKQYTVNFDPNGGTCVRATSYIGYTAPYYEENSGTEEEPVWIGLPNATSNYATFGGWITTDGERAGHTGQNVISKDQTLTAVWNDPKSFDLTVNGKATADGVTWNTDYTYTANDATDLVSITIGGEAYYDATVEDATYTIPGEDITGAVVITDTATSAGEAVLTYQLDGKTVYVTTAKLEGALPKVNLPTKTGYTVDGWYTDADCNEKPSSEAVVTGDQTFYAKSTVNSYCVSFVNGDSILYTNIVDYGSKVSFPGSPEKYGYKFIGWKGTTEDGTEVVTITSGNLSKGYTMPAKNIIFSAVWQESGKLIVIVADNAGNRVTGATVRLYNSGELVDTAETTGHEVQLEGGTTTEVYALFDDLQYGAYNIVVNSALSNGDTVNTTCGADITGGNTSVTVTVPNYKLNTGVDSNISVNLTAENLANASSSSISGNQEVTVTLSAAQASKVEQAAIENSDALASYQKSSNSNVKLTDYIELTITQNISTTDAEGEKTDATTTLTNTKGYQIISIEVSPALYAQLQEWNGTANNILVYREHDGSVSRLSKTDEATGKKASAECYWTKNVEGTDYIVLKVNKFSTYAFGVSDKAVGNDNIGASNNGGHGISSNKTVIIQSTIENGTVTANNIVPEAGETVTLTVKPVKGYTLDKLTVKDSASKTVEVTKVNDTTYTFVQPSSVVTVNATFKETTTKSESSSSSGSSSDSSSKTETIPQTVPETKTEGFVDVADSDYFHDAVEWAAQKGITSGKDDTHFAPSDITTRAQMVAFLYRAAGSPDVTVTDKFTDVSADSYYAKAVAWGVENGIVKGISDTEFGPDVNVTRAQAVTFLNRLSGTTASASDTFSDVTADSYYAGAVAWAVENNITAGTSETTFAPNADCLRAQVVTFLYRYFVK